MNNIKIMDEKLANKIAAGEVVESCSSVVKELVENSIDASATEISITLVEGGLKEIRVTDNGVGMSEEDAKLAFLRHATSKITKEDDLYFINTLGFRGEALPSIAAVSIVNLKTCQDNIGIEINIMGGKIDQPLKCEARKGTSILIKDLFYNTPARLKYLKGAKEELILITTYIEKIALSHPQIKFSLLNNNRSVLKTTGSGDLLKTIYEIYGYNVSSNMLPIKGGNDDYDINGYICKPSILKSNRNHLIALVNGRVVRNNELNRAINDAYYTHKPDNKFPIVIINIATDPTLVDVNIHPTKQDIKFSKMNELTKLLTDLIKEALANSNLIEDAYYKAFTSNEINEILKVEEESVSYNFSDSRKTAVLEPPLAKEQIDFNFGETKEKLTVEETSNKIKVEEVKTKLIYPVALLLGTYIVCQNEEGIYLIDQHAAQERVNYEKYMNALENREIHTTSLLIPITIELPKSEYLVIKDNIKHLTDMGFLIEDFGINTLIVKEHPTWLKTGYEEESIHKIFDLIVDLRNDFNQVKFNENIAITLACKLSIKANYEISLEEMEYLVNELFKCDNPYNCPHGRPTIITFTVYELEKMFKRVMN